MTVVPASPAGAVRVNAAETRSGLPSDTWPRAVQPVGVAMVVARLMPTTSTSWSPGWTDAGTVTPGLVALVFDDAAARNAIALVAGGTVTDRVSVSDPPPGSVTVNVTV